MPILYFDADYVYENIVVLFPIFPSPWEIMIWLGFLKILNYVTKEREQFSAKMSSHLSQLNVAMAHSNYSRQNNMQFLKLATYTKIEDHYSRCKLATF